MIDKISEKQKSLISVYQKKWSDKFFSLEFDEDKAFRFVDFLYNLIGKPSPVKIILDSPLAVQLAINMLKLDDNSQLSSQLDSQLSSQLRSQLRSQLDSQLRSQKLKYYSFDYWGDTSWYGYLCFYDYLYNEIFKEKKIELFEKYLELVDSNINFMTTFEEICFISKPPNFIKFNEENRLHCTSDYAITYADGYKLNFVRGVYFEEKLFNKVFKEKNINSEEILNVENSEQKAIIIGELGFEKIFNNLKEKTVLDEQVKSFNKQPDKPVKYTLFKTFIGNLNCHVLRVEWYEQKNVKRETFLGVPNTINDAIEAVAWTCYTTKVNWENKLLMEA